MSQLSLETIRREALRLIFIRGGRVIPAQSSIEADLVNSTTPFSKILRITRDKHCFAQTEMPDTALMLSLDEFSKKHLVPMVAQL